MKKLFVLAIVPLFASYSPYYEEQPPYEPCPFDYPYNFEGGYLSTGNATFQSKEFDNLRYAVGETKVGYLFPLNPCTGILIGAGYAHTTFDWNNPFFNQKEYQEISLSLSGFTKCVNCWLWKGSIGIWQQTDIINVGRYGLYEGFLWGRYDCSKTFGWHVGILGLVGKRKALVRPIIGFDWQWSRQWKLNAVYPVDMSIVYCMTKKVSLAGAFRFNRTRMRTGPVEPVSEALFEYRSWGAEFRLTYEPLPNIRIDFFAGSIFFAWLKVNNRINKRITYQDLDPVGYVGGYAYAVF